MILGEAMQKLRELVICLLLSFVSIATAGFIHNPYYSLQDGYAYCQSWRLAVEVNNVRGWRTVPTQCLRYVESYMLGGQYERDVALIVDQIVSYASEIAMLDDGMDAWILDVDDTCISNLNYYRLKKYGGEAFDAAGFKAWAMMAGCPAVPGVLGLFNKLIERGFKVFLVTGRDQGTLGEPTAENLKREGFIGYQRLVMRTPEHRGKSAVAYKSEIRKQLTQGEGYRIWGNVGDQWSDLQGECLGNRTFKLPNPMYFVP